MRVHRPAQFVSDRAWGAIDIERIEDASVRLHWTNAAYIWHVNDGPEVFVVLDGAVDMHVRDANGESCQQLAVGDIFHAKEGDEHKAVPIGEARILVIERAGSV
ncbi:cupin [Sphingomonas sp. So64.6b]|uniref:cupin n=1 Tax=Sphingomonas sp. So64.6b TaxID=2997354 RepID=UPI0016035BD1|nr:cupin [Sphingomonas sp. So64.6b]QNA86360.1 cupin [Sphingomonas sp. So64.6b]